MLASFTPVVRQWIPVWPMNKRFVSSILRIRLGPLIIGDLSLRREIEGNYFLSTIPLFHYWLFSSIHLNNFSFENFQRRLNEDSSWTQFLQDGENGKTGSHFHLDWFFFSRVNLSRKNVTGKFFSRLVKRLAKIGFFLTKDPRQNRASRAICVAWRGFRSMESSAKRSYYLNEYVR